MKKFLLLQLYRAGNKELDNHTCNTLTEAIAYFKTIYPEVNLDEDGYAQEGDQSFCVGEVFNPISH